MHSLEDCHEKLEEKYIFPVVRKDVELRGTVAVLLEQHKIGRELTDFIIKKEETNDPAGKNIIAEKLALIVKMFRAHESREDTVIFPAFRKALSEKEYDDLGSKFIDEENELLGEDSFEITLRRVESIEAKLAINDLSTYSVAR